jgi:F-type H+-transporting ATPase subunit b
MAIPVLEIGLPQFDIQWWPGQIFWTLVTFAVLFFLMRWIFVPRIGGGISGREDQIAGDVGLARKLKEEAEAQHAAAEAERAEAHAKARAIGADAKAKADEEIAAKRAVEDAKVAESLAIAEVAIRTAKEQSMSNVRAIASDAARQIVGKLTGAEASASEVDTALAGRS